MLCRRVLQCFFSLSSTSCRTSLRRCSKRRELLMGVLSQLPPTCTPISNTDFPFACAVMLACSKYSRAERRVRNSSLSANEHFRYSSDRFMISSLSTSASLMKVVQVQFILLTLRQSTTRFLTTKELSCRGGLAVTCLNFFRERIFSCYMRLFFAICCSYWLHFAKKSLLVIQLPHSFIIPSNLNQSHTPHSITRNHLQLSPKFQKDVSTSLIRIYPYSVHCQDGSCFLVHFELCLRGFTSSHTQRITAEKGASSGTDITLKGCSISEVRITLKVTLFPFILNKFSIQMTYYGNKIVIIDNGTGFTKMGYAGNAGPAFDIPTLIADAGESSSASITLSNKKITETVDFSIGEEAREMYRTHRVVNPIEGGIVRNWDLMEKFWHRSIFDYLRCDPEESVFVLTEPPLNPPQNREHIAEIMFQTFNAKGLYISVQAVMALISASGLNRQVSYTGTVLDSGDGVTHIIPIVDGFVINSVIKHIPLAGSNMTNFIAGMIRDRNEKVPVEEVSRVARIIKEKYGYVVESGDLLAEFANFDNRMRNANLTERYDQFVQGIDPISKVPYKVSVGPERFLAPEMFFNPEIVNENYRQSVDEMIDKMVQMCPIDTRRVLYQNIALSGGSTLFNGFKQRLQRRVKERVHERLSKYESLTQQKSTPINVKVLDNPYQRYAVWQGASMFSSAPGFQKMYHTRKQYQEYGPSICRHNAVFSP